MRAQTAMEYLSIVGIILVFVIPIWAYLITLEQQTASELSLAYSKNAARQIADASSLVYSQGPPAKLSFQVYVPAGVKNILIDNKSIVFNISLGATYTDVFSTSVATMNGTLTPNEGYYTIEVISLNSLVQINQKYT
jgi:uncharacterized protein (UPF0333 family)